MTLDELMHKYRETFNDQFPLMIVRNTSEQEIINMIEDCIKTGLPFEPEMDEDVDYGKVCCQPTPSFIDSPYFVEEPFNWHLTEDAPDHIKKEFEEYMKESVTHPGEVITFAKAQGYDDASYIGKWKEYEVYEPVYSGDDVSFVGVPLLILVKGDSIRMSTVEEAFEPLNNQSTLTK